MRKRPFHVYLLMFVTLVSPNSCSSSHSSDAALIENFHSHQADFEKLVTMLSEDRHLVRLTAERVFFDNDTTTLSNERLAEYRQLLKILKLAGGVARGPDGLHLTASTRGMFVPYSAKGYSYLLKEPTQLVDSLDAVINQNPGDQRMIWRRISGDWYLTYESW